MCGKDTLNDLVVHEVTNEEYIRQCSTEELVNLIVCELRNADLHNMRLKYNLFNGNDFDVVRVWLKGKHEPLKNDKK